MPSWWGLLSGGLGVCIVIGVALLGTLITVLAGTDPGPVLGVFTVAGTVVAALAVQSRFTHLIVPVPALVYVVMATMAGLIHDGASETSSTALAVDLAQWVASGFVAIIVATAVAVAVAVLRHPRTSFTPGTRRGTSGSGNSRSGREYSPSAARSARSRHPEGARAPSAPRRADRDFDYPSSPGPAGARDAGRYPPRHPGPRDSDPYERWYRTDSRLVPAATER
jgi:hypothetical protein